jgi:uncharacterized UPF0160 family protein
VVPPDATFLDLANRLSFVRSQSGNKDQGSDSVVDAGCYHGPGIGMRDKHQRTIGPLQRTVKRRDIV